LCESPAFIFYTISHLCVRFGEDGTFPVIIDVGNYDSSLRRQVKGQMRANYFFFIVISG